MEERNAQMRGRGGTSGEIGWDVWEPTTRDPARNNEFTRYFPAIERSTFDDPIFNTRRVILATCALPKTTLWIE